MSIDFYHDVKEKLSSLIKKCGIDDRYSLRFFNTLNRDFLKFLDDNNYSFIDDGKRHFYNGTVISYEDYQILYVKDRLNKNLSKIFFNDGKNIIEIDNIIDKNVQNDEIIESNKSLVYFNGKLKNMILSVYNKTVLCNEMVYESVICAHDDIDLDLAQNFSDKIEISYFLGEPLNGKYNDALVGNLAIENYIDLAKSKIKYILDFFDNFDLEKSKTKKK